MFLGGTEKLMVGFASKTEAFAPVVGINVASLAAQAMASSIRFVVSTIESAATAAGLSAEAIGQILDAFGAQALLDALNEALEEATTPADLAAVGTVLPIIKKILRFLVRFFNLKLPFDLDQVLEFIDELATTAMDQASAKGAEAMHRSSVRFLEAQYPLDRLTSLKEAPAADNGG